MDLYVHVIVYVCMYVPIAVGLFTPLSYQDRAVQLAYNNNGMNQICFESFKPFSTNASEVWQDGKSIKLAS